MAVEDVAVWRGRITQQVGDHDRRLDAIEDHIEDVEKTVGKIHDAMLVHRARMSMFAAIGAVIGSGLGGSIMVALLHH